jgi:hypothetical protein
MYRLSFGKKNMLLTEREALDLQSDLAYLFPRPTVVEPEVQPVVSPDTYKLAQQGEHLKSAVAFAKKDLIIDAIKEIRQPLGMGLAEAKYVVEVFMYETGVRPTLPPSGSEVVYGSPMLRGILAMLHSYNRD